MSEIYQLISITEQRINDTDTQSVNARELHGFLESKQDFSTWIKKRISDYGFTQDVDFIVQYEKSALETKMYGQGKIDYYITLDMAKELAMVERNDKGKEARRYFIECERKLKEQRHTTPQLEYTPAQRALVDSKALLELSDMFKVNRSFATQEIASYTERTSGCDVVAKLLTQSEYMNDVPDKDVMLEPTELGKHYGLSGKAMNEKLKELDLQYRHKDNWLPTEKGKPICKRHAWAVANKSGYNLKWNWQAIDDLIQNNAL